jgi:hypothetical protein
LAKKVTGSCSKLVVSLWKEDDTFSLQCELLKIASSSVMIPAKNRFKIIMKIKYSKNETFILFF